MCGVGGAGVHSSVGGGAVGWGWNGERCGGMNGLAVRQGGIDQAWETWKHLHWLSKMEAVRNPLLSHPDNLLTSFRGID